MNSNQQFAISCHILTALAAYPDQVVTSEKIAESVATNPAFIRRVMSHLRQHGFVDSRPGTSGGWRLLHPAEHISLGDIYRAVSHESVLATHQHPNPDCLIGGNILETLTPVFAKAQTAMETALDEFNVANLLDNILREHLIT